MFTRNELVPFVQDLKKNVFGYDDLWDGLIHHPFDLDTTFPKDNVIKLKNTVIVELALAGYAKEDITIERDGASLVVKGRKEVKEEDEDVHYVRKNIAQRSFTKSYTVGAEYKGIRARFKDGILSIHLEKSPEEENKKLVEIS